ncbi:MAG: type II secretion system protein [Bacilli bacterium]|nr:type II secretion system protein [Bacilli bacterium]
MKKGFTLIELLAVIVILAIIMVIAVPQVLHVIDSSRKTAWIDNVKLIKKSLELDYSINNDPNATISQINCSDPNKFLNNFSKIVDIDMDSTQVSNISYNNNICSFKLTPKMQFDGQSEVTMNCSHGKCTFE